MFRTVILIFFIAVGVYIYNNEELRGDILDLAQRAMGTAVSEMKEDVKDLVEKHK